MSWELSHLCWKCKKKEDCIDKPIIKIAVDTINSLNSDNRHLGEGTIVMSCQRIDTLNEEVQTDYQD